MANTPYSDGVPDTAPQTSVGDDYQHVDATPSAFGGLISQGAQQAGAGASKAGQFFGQAAVDDQINSVMARAQAIRTGDPSQTSKGQDGTPILGADGTPQPDTGYLGKTGADALHGWKPALAQLDAAISDGRKNLSSPEQQLEFDSQTRRMRSMWADEIGRHADTQAKSWMGAVSNVGATRALNGIAANPSDAISLAHNSADLINFRVKAAEAAYGDSLTDDEKTQVIASAKQEALKAQIQSISVSDPARAQRILEKNRSVAGTEYEPLANALRSRADQAISDSAADKALAGPAQQQAGTPAAPGPGVANPAAVVRHFEGFRTNAYWDVNHWRVGYGSDTVTNADGSVSPVTAMTTVSREDAERDLSRRVQQSQAHAEAAVGPQAWERVSPQARASITSVAYNYGRLPAQLVGPIQSGDNHQIALAIHNLGADNGGVNAQRRAVEAANVVGKFGLSGVEALRGYAPMMTMPSAVAGNSHPLLSAMAADAAAAPLDQPPAWAGGLVAVRADPNLSQPPAPPQSAAQAALSPSEAATPPIEPAPAPDPLTRKAAAFQTIENDPTLNDRQKEMAYAKISRQVQAESIAQEADAKSKAELNEKTAGTYFERIENGEVKDLAPQIINDRRMRYETRHALLDLLERTSGDRNVKNLGPGYADAYKRIMLPENDPQRIVDPLDLYRQGAPGGPLTMSGVGRLKGVLDAVRKSTDDAAVNRVKSGMLSYANEKLTYTIPGIPGMTPDKRDPKGTMLFNSEFVPRLEAAYDAYIKAGHNPWDANSPLAKKNVEALIEQIRPQRQKAQDQVSDPKAEHDPNARAVATDSSDGLLPPPPRGVDWNGWVQVVSRPPASPGGQPASYAFWAQEVNKLVSNPTPRMIGFFNETYGKYGFDGGEVLQAMGVHKGTPIAIPTPKPPPAPPEPDLGRTANVIRGLNQWLTNHEEQHGPVTETMGQKIGDWLMRRHRDGAPGAEAVSEAKK